MRRINPALIMHRRFLSSTDINNHINHNNLFIEYTFLKEGRKINEIQQLILYHVRDVVSYVTRKNNNLIVCQKIKDKALNY